MLARQLSRHFVLNRTRHFALNEQQYRFLKKSPRGIKNNFLNLGLKQKNKNEGGPPYTHFVQIGRDRAVVDRFYNVKISTYDDYFVILREMVSDRFFLGDPVLKLKCDKVDPSTIREAKKIIAKK